MGPDRSKNILAQTLRDRHVTSFLRFRPSLFEGATTRPRILLVIHDTLRLGARLASPRCLVERPVLLTMEFDDVRLVVDALLLVVPLAFIASTAWALAQVWMAPGPEAQLRDLASQILDAASRGCCRRRCGRRGGGGDGGRL